MGRQGETSKPEDLPNRFLSVMLPRRGRPTIRTLHHLYRYALSICVCVMVFPFVCLADTEIGDPYYQQLKVSNYGKKTNHFHFGADAVRGRISPIDHHRPQRCAILDRDRQQQHGCGHRLGRRFGSLYTHGCYLGCALGGQHLSRQCVRHHCGLRRAFLLHNGRQRISSDAVLQ